MNIIYLPEDIKIVLQKKVKDYKISLSIFSYMLTTENIFPYELIEKKLITVEQNYFLMKQEIKSIIKNFISIEEKPVYYNLDFNKGLLVYGSNKIEIENFEF